MQAPGLVNQVPLVAANKTIGAAWLAQTDHMRSFTDEQVKFATVIGTQAALAIDYAANFQATPQGSSLDSPAKGSGHRLCASLGDAESIADHALKAINKQLSCQATSIYFYDGRLNSLVNLAFIGHPPEVMEELKLIPMERTTFLTEAMRQGAMITQDSYHPEDMFDDQKYILKALGVETCRRIHRPIFYKEEVVGGMAITFTGEQPFSGAAFDALKSIANHLALAIQSYKLPLEGKMTETDTSRH